MSNLDKLNNISSGVSKWIEDAEERKKNKTWQRHSQRIAIKVLRAIRELGITQKELAARMDISAQMVNKIVKGKENLTLQTIAKLESALGVSILVFEADKK